ncbi:unnamed protein product [Owenia fusiformis]|uniref:Peptidase S54 rhomboid domain-containing protein n=1 Tax=Owenia fusiformis TaxID=6347 RepID=A0A8J1T5G8_OWEFU|nr:unnamed protein product [Owenia fusiformis]
MELKFFSPLHVYLDSSAGAGDWRDGVTCRARPPGQNSVAHILKPCCHGYMGHCLLATHEHCLFIGGQFQKRADHCSQVDCISILCGFGGFSKTKDKPYKPESINHWWRLFFGLLHHHGIFHWLMVAAIQLLIGRQIEKLAGWLRIAIIYILSGVFGLLVGAIFNPHRAQVGGGAAIFGLLGVLLVELIQSWELVANRSFELFKLTNIFLLLLFISTLPPLDNISHIAGTIMGCLSGIILLPYITFNRWHVRRKRILIGVLSPLVFGMMFIVLYIFYSVQPVDICPGCDYINCVPYFIGICD